MFIARELVQHGLVDDHLTHKVKQDVDLFDVDTNRAGFFLAVLLVLSPLDPIFTAHLEAGLQVVFDFYNGSSHALGNLDVGLHLDPVKYFPDLFDGCGGLEFDVPCQVDFTWFVEIEFGQSAVVGFQFQLAEFAERAKDMLRLIAVFQKIGFGTE